MLQFFYNLCKDALIQTFGIRRKPRVIQMPITSRCNSKCLTCNIWKRQETKVDIDPTQLARILDNSFFSEVDSIGINGGEPSIHPHFIEVINSVLTLPKLKNIYVISNCIANKHLLELLETAHKMCRQKGVRLSLQISIDGIADLHNKIRGVKISYKHSINIVNQLLDSRNKYVDYFDIGCTISRYNIDYIKEIEDTLNELGVPVYYHLAVPNKRIHNFKQDDFSVETDSHSLQMAKEFFYEKSFNAQRLGDRVKYYLIYSYLCKHPKVRKFSCSYLYRDVTINENLELYLCATASDKIIDLGEKQQSIKGLQKCAVETKRCCGDCIHYATSPNLFGYIEFFRYRIKYRNWIKQYK